MIENLHSSVTLTFIAATFLTLMLFYVAIKNAKAKTGYIMVGLIAWLAIQAAIALSGFYQDTTGFPPKFALAPFPALLTILILFVTKKGRKFIDSLPIDKLTYIHIVRIPVELVLYWLFLSHAVPQLMTFDGRNFDILAGLTAPLIAYYGFQIPKLSRGVILAWNLICLALLFNIVINAVLSAPFVIQQFGFEQPDIAILYFPFNWLPAFIVPVVLFSHLVCIRQLVKRENIPIGGPAV